MRDVHNITEDVSAKKQPKNTGFIRDVHHILEDASTKKQQKNISVLEEGASKYSRSIVATTSSSSKMRDSWLLARDIALWYCKSLMPLGSVSDDGMIDFFHVRFSFLIFTIFYTYYVFESNSI